MKISYVIPCYNSSKALKKVVFQITEKMRLMSNYEYEIILVDDFSRDDTMTVIQNLCKECDSIKGLGFSRNFGQHAALMAGFRQVTGDIIVCLDDDGQTPAEEADNPPSLRWQAESRERQSRSDIRAVIRDNFISKPHFFRKLRRIAETDLGARTGQTKSPPSQLWGRKATPPRYHPHSRGTCHPGAHSNLP